MMMDIIKLKLSTHYRPNKSKTLFVSIHFNETFTSKRVEWMVPSCYPTTLNSKSLSQGGSSTRQKKMED